MAKIVTETCVGCGEEIPNAETPYIWNNETLCKKCWAKVVASTRPLEVAPRSVTKCANCDRTIGKLEAPLFWGGEAVCMECHERLAQQPSPVKAPLNFSETPDEFSERLRQEGRERLSSPKRRPVAGEVICPNPHCGFIGKPVKKSRGNVVVMVFLLFIGVLPGLIYAIFNSGYDYFCPHCQMKLRSESR